MTRSGRDLTVTSDALDQLVQDGYSLAFGARFLKRLIEERIKLPISQRWSEGTHFIARAADGKVSIDVAAGKGRLTLAATA
jgi:ATP-dependent Clp protease ATP-binding subunit ClpA